MTTAGSRRRWWALAVALAAVLVVVLLAWGDRGGGGDGTAEPSRTPLGRTPSATATPVVPSSPAPTPSPGGATGLPAPPAPDAVETPATDLPALVDEIESGTEHLPPVEAGEIARIAPAVTVVLERVERVDAQARGRGEISGPALALTLTVTNEGEDALTLADTVVNLYGDAGVAGSLFTDDPRADPFAGAVEPGGRATATYVASLPPTSAGRVVVSVSVGAESPTPLFIVTASEDF